jgi:NOL1/NOP2/fmu family ribosome biogenesis protein
MTDQTETQSQENQGHRFDRLPATEAERTVEGRATRQEVLDWWEERFGVPAEVFDEFTFWERGAGKIWAFHDDAPTPIEVEGLGLAFLRTRQEHWKPTLEAAQRFGHHADRNVITLTREQAETFVAGDDQELDWDGDWGYVIASHELAGQQEPLGVGLYLYGELRSQVPKGRRRDL